MVLTEWKRYFGYGTTALHRHEPREALRFFQKALDVCPVTSSRELDTILYFLGITLVKLGMTGAAIRSFCTARKLHPHGYGAKMFQRYANEYGMARQNDPDLDDWNAFYAMQLAMYLSGKASRKFGSLAERQMIQDLLSEYWVNMKQSGVLSGLSSAQKMDFFARQQVVFPRFQVPTTESGSLLAVDFRKKSKMNATDYCSCGSTRSFGSCCGRICTEEEILFGVF